MMDEEAVVRMFVGLVFCLDDSSCFARSDLRFARLVPLNLWLLLLPESSMINGGHDAAAEERQSMDNAAADDSTSAASLPCGR